MKEKLLERKKSLEADIDSIISKRNDVTEKMLKPAQKAISELATKHQQLDNCYQEICSLLGEDAREEWAKYQAAKTDKVAEVDVPKEKGKK